jgi:putative transposase
MDGKGCWRDKVFVGRLWKSVKYEEAYPKACDSVPEAKASSVFLYTACPSN